MVSTHFLHIQGHHALLFTSTGAGVLSVYTNRKLSVLGERRYREYNNNASPPSEARDIAFLIKELLWVLK